jgi:UDP-N-acetylglucosamine--N-acetylmuramyl-(pentapeptide) pyrophosphoryl-undecaprenol N-acetylglucosamine transferase
VPSQHTNILFAAGGTGGHLYPALAIADEITKQRPDARFLFVGTKGKIEARVVPERGFAFTTIWISGFHRGLRLQNLLFPLKVPVSLVQSFFLIKRFRPDVVVGTGGYVCGPVLFVASLLGVPTVIHESNSYPGITTRLLAARSTRVFTAFGATNRWLKRTENVELVGTPTRGALDGVSKSSATSFFGLDEHKQTVLIFGGSLGASSVNRSVERMIDRFAQQGVQVVWQTGERGYARIERILGGRKIGWVGKYIDRMETAYAAADLVVSRSGATTIAELTRIGKPAILVPYPYSAADHQTMNARSIADAGAAVIVADRDVDQILEKTIFALLNDPSKMESMAQAGKSIGRPQAGAAIAEKILELVRTQVHEEGIQI